MPMMKKSEFGGGDEKNRYCKFCTYEDGNLLPRHVVRENMIIYYMKMKKIEREDAASYVDEHMAGMPAWQ